MTVLELVTKLLKLCDEDIEALNYDVVMDNAHTNVGKVEILELKIEKVVNLSE